MVLRSTSAARHSDGWNAWPRAHEGARARGLPSTRQISGPPVPWNHRRCRGQRGARRAERLSWSVSASGPNSREPPDGTTPAACRSHPPAATASNQLRLRYRSMGWRSIPIPIPTPMVRTSVYTTDQRVPRAVEPLPLSWSARRPTRRAVVVVVVEPRSVGRVRMCRWHPMPTPMKAGDDSARALCGRTEIGVVVGTGIGAEFPGTARRHDPCRVPVSPTRRDRIESTATTVPKYGLEIDSDSDTDTDPDGADFRLHDRSAGQEVWVTHSLVRFHTNPCRRTRRSHTPDPACQAACIGLT
jgi:hypothetical protein